MLDTCHVIFLIFFYKIKNYMHIYIYFYQNKLKNTILLFKDGFLEKELK
jgi:hypothetical protein